MQGRRSGWFAEAVALLLGGLITTPAGLAQEFSGTPHEQPGPWLASSQSADPAPAAAGMVTSLDQLAGLTPQQLDWLYMHASAGPIPSGKTRGRLIVDPEARWARATALGSRAVWQGKVFRPSSNTAINRFFGIRVIRAQVGYGPSWRDGGQSIVLDYSQTSRLYEPYRDEIRQVGPGLYLGLMYERTVPQATLKLYFALEDRTQGGR